MWCSVRALTAPAPQSCSPPVRDADSDGDDFQPITCMPYRMLDPVTCQLRSRTEEFATDAQLDVPWPRFAEVKFAGLHTNGVSRKNRSELSCRAVKRDGSFVVEAGSGLPVSFRPDQMTPL